MKAKYDEEVRKILLLLKLDSQRLFERIKSKRSDYLGVFAIKRIRTHFGEVFDNRYSEMSLEELKHCSEETLILLDKFYHHVEEILWYLNHTEDMPATVEDRVKHQISELEGFYEGLRIHLEAELEAVDNRE